MSEQVLNVTFLSSMDYKMKHCNSILAKSTINTERIVRLSTDIKTGTANRQAQVHSKQWMIAVCVRLSGDTAEGVVFCMLSTKCLLRMFYNPVASSKCYGVDS